MSKASLILVAFIWGITNSLISKASKKKKSTKEKNNKKESFGALDWITNPLYIVSVAINLLGSLLFFYILSSTSKGKQFQYFIFIRNFYCWTIGKFNDIDHYGYFRYSNQQ